MKRFKNYLLLSLLVLVASCSPKNVTYFQGLPDGLVQTVTNVEDIRLKPNDKLSIVVNSKDPELTSLFNLPYISLQLGKRNGSYTGGIQGLSCYTIDKDGNIDFPILGPIHVGGMNREEISAYVKNELESRNLVKNPVVTVEFMNLYISVLGEVKNPGRIAVDRDKITIIDAISMAGDLTIQGRRDNIMVQREEGDKRTIYRVDLNAGADIFDSPVYYLQQNDVVYVEPNGKRLRDATVNGNYFRSGGFWMGLASLIISLSTLIVTAN